MEEGNKFENPQAEITELKERLQKLEGQIEQEKTPEKKKEFIKEEIKEYIQEVQQTPSFAAPTHTRDEPDELADLPSSQKVGALISLVFEKGLEYAIKTARTLDNPAILDEFHDMLVDRYYEELIQRKMLK